MPRTIPVPDMTDEEKFFASIAKAIIYVRKVTFHDPTRAEIFTQSSSEKAMQQLTRLTQEVLDALKRGREA